MAPTTHYLYLALALFAIGLGGAVIRRSLVVVLLGIQLMFAAVALLLATYAHAFGEPSGQAAAVVVALVGVLEVAVAVAVVARLLRAEPGEGRSPIDALRDWTLSPGREAHELAGDPGASPSDRGGRR